MNIISTRTHTKRPNQYQQLWCQTSGVEPTAHNLLEITQPAMHKHLDKQKTQTPQQTQEAQSPYKEGSVGYQLVLNY